MAPDGSGVSPLTSRGPARVWAEREGKLGSKGHCENLGPNKTRCGRVGWRARPRAGGVDAQLGLPHS